MSTKTSAALLVALALGLVGCSEDPSVVVDGGAGRGGDTGEGGTAGSAGQGGTGGSGGGNTDPLKAPKLDGATAALAGRKGGDLHLQLSGSDPDGDVDTLLLRFLDASGAPLVLFDSDMDGAPDTAEILTGFDESLSRKKEFSATSTLRGYGKGASVELTLIDAEGNHSNHLRATITPQPVRQLNEACDVDFLEARCSDGLTCRGEPATCHEGIAPEISRLGYLRSAAGPRILIEGLDPDDDMKSVILEFFDASGGSVLLDLDNDGIPEASRATFDADGTSKDGAFFVAYDTEPGFDTNVQGLAATPVDAAGRRGSRQEANLADAAARNRGQTCDPYGFDVCRDGLACDPGVPGASNKCQNISSVSKQVCTAALLLEPANGSATVTGKVQGTSGLWEPPEGCTATQFPGMPESVVRLRLAATAPILRITTDRPGTDFDTILYLMRGCETDPENALACNDDRGRGGTSSIELTNVPAGDYLIVVDSWNRTGGHFELSVTVL